MNLTLRLGPLSLRLSRCGLRLTAWLGAACLLLGLLSLQSGALRLSLQALWQTLNGHGEPLARMVLLQWRLPRLLAALLLGAALGVSGAIFQSLIRNPLGSPDIIGFNSGAHSGALLVIVLWQGNGAAIAAGAIGGGLCAALLVYLLAWRGGAHGLRLIIIGIAVSAMLGAFNTWLTLSASLQSAMSAALWGAGSLSGMSWARTLPAMLCCLPALLLALLLGPRMRLLEMGDDSARALGVAAGRSRLLLMAVGVTLSAAATAAAGPITFIALAAPQLAQRLLRREGTQLLCAAAMGALLLLLADYLAQHLFAPHQLPVGMVTVCIGGLYLVWLLLNPPSGRT